MFARTNFVQNSLTKVVQNRGLKTDKELLEEIKNEAGDTIGFADDAQHIRGANIARAMFADIDALRLGNNKPKGNGTCKKGDDGRDPEWHGDGEGEGEVGCGGLAILD